MVTKISSQREIITRKPKVGGPDEECGNSHQSIEGNPGGREKPIGRAKEWRFKKGIPGLNAGSRKNRTDGSCQLSDDNRNKYG